MGELSLGTPQSERPIEDRLDSWKEIAAYLKRDVTTVQRWERREGMPVHRHQHDKMGSVYAFRADLDTWMQSRNLQAEEEEEEASAPAADPMKTAAPVSDAAGPIVFKDGITPTEPRRQSALRWIVPVCGVAVLLLVAGAVYRTE